MRKRSRRNSFALVLAAGALAFVGLVACGGLLGIDEDPSSAGESGDGSDTNDSDGAVETGRGATDGGVVVDGDAGRIPCGTSSCAALAEQCCWSTSGNGAAACAPLGSACPHGDVALACAYRNVGCSVDLDCCIGYGPDGGPLGARCGCMPAAAGEIWDTICTGVKTFACPLDFNCEQADAYPPEYATCRPSGGI